MSLPTDGPDQFLGAADDRDDEGILLPGQDIPAGDEDDGSDKLVQLTSWTHLPQTSEDDVMVDMALLPAGAREGDVAELKSVETGVHLYFTIKPLTDELARITPPVQVCQACI